MIVRKLVNLLEESTSPGHRETILVVDQGEVILVDHGEDPNQDDHH